MRLRGIQLTSRRDLPMFLFLWRWKVVSTAALHVRFYQEASRARCFKRLRMLEKSGYVVASYIAEWPGFAWTLNKKGFDAIRGLLPDGVGAGFKSEAPYHDLLATAVQLGDCLVESPKNVAFFSEQQLRRRPREFWPDWIPKDFSRRPDGFTIVQRGDTSHVIAIEIERSAKQARDLEDIGHAYARSLAIHWVLWAMPAERRIRDMRKHLTELDNTRREIHNFVTLESIQEFGWQAAIVEGAQKGVSLREFFGLAQGGRSPGETPEKSPTLLFFDRRKSYGKTAG